MSSSTGNLPESLVDIHGDDDTTSLYSDDIVKLRLNGQIYTAHRKALSSKSGVFKKQLKKLKADESLEILDMEESICEPLLSFVYSGTVDQAVLKEKAVQLWIAADKYQMDTLKQLCESSLCPNLISSTVTEVLLLAHEHNIVRLKKASIEYLNEHSLEVINSNRPKWRHLVTNGDTSLFGDLLTELAPLYGKVQATNKKQSGILARLRNEPRIFFESSPSEYFELVCQVFQILAFGFLAILALALIFLFGMSITSGFTHSGWFIALAIFLLILPICIFICCLCKGNR